LNFVALKVLLDSLVGDKQIIYFLYVIIRELTKLLNLVTIRISEVEQVIQDSLLGYSDLFKGIC
jgi:hypothetical protein